MSENYQGKLKKGFAFRGEQQFDFEMRPVMTAQELFDAEQEADVEQQLSFNGALMARQLVRIGECEGPFDLSMIGKLHPVDFQELRKAQNALQVTEKNALEGAAASGNPSS